MELVTILNIVFFAIIALVLLSMIIGFFRKTFVSLAGFIVFALLVLIFAISLDATSKFILNYDLTAIPQIPESFDFALNGVEHTIYLTTIRAALEDVLRAVTESFGASAEASASFEQYVAALTINIGKFFTFSTLILIAWFVSGVVTFITRIVMHFAKRSNPKRKVFHLGSGLLSGAKTLIAFFAIIMPFTAIANAVLIAYNDPNNAEVDGSQNSPAMQQVGEFASAYDQSLLSKIMFSWTKSPTTGKTLDLTLMDWIAGEKFNDRTVAFTDEIISFTGIAKTIASSGLLEYEGDWAEFDWSILATEPVLDTLFNNLKNSQLVMSATPMLLSLLLTSENNTLIHENFKEPLLEDSLIKDYVVEYTAIQNLIRGLIRADAIVAIIDLLTKEDVEGNTYAEALYQSLLNETSLTHMREGFTYIDSSILCSRYVPAILASLALKDEPSNIEGFLKEIMPLTYDRFAEYSWSKEVDVVFSALAQIYQVDPTFTDFITEKMGTTGEETWEDYILNNKESVANAFCGPLDAEDNLVNVDENNVYLGEVPVMLDSKLVMESAEDILRFGLRQFNVQNGISLFAFEAKVSLMDDDDLSVKRANYKVGLREIIEIMVSGSTITYDNIEEVFPVPESIIVDSENHTVTTTEDLHIDTTLITESGYEIPEGLEYDEDGNVILPAGTYVDDDGIHLPDGTTIPVTPPAGRHHFIPGLIISPDFT
ncbi:MAG: hypothetical protein ACOX3K_04495 [Bacilli bacterium]